MKGHTGGVTALAFSHDGELLSTGGSDGTVRVWDTRSAAERYALAEHSDAVTTITFSPDGKLLLSGSNDKSVRIWDLTDGTARARKLGGHFSGIRAAALAADGSKTYVVDLLGNAYVWDVRSMRIVVASPSSSNDHGLATFRLEGTHAAISEKGSGLRVWDAGAARNLVVLREQTESPVSTLAWLGPRLFVGDQAGTLSVYDLTELTLPISELVTHACGKGRVLSHRFTWIESAADPLIREVWDPEGTSRPVCY